MDYFQLSRATQGSCPQDLGIEQGNYLITGASGEIGSALTKFFSSKTGVTVFAGVRSEERFRQAGLDRLPNVVPVSATAEGFESVFHAGREIRGVIHCEGTYGEIGAITEVDSENWVDNLATSTKRTLLLIRSMANSKQQTQIAAIFLGGGGATEAYVGLSNYSAIKSTLVRLIETSALEIDSTKLVLNALGPGPTNSRMVNAVLTSHKRVDPRIMAGSLKLRESNKATSDRLLHSVTYLLSPKGRKLNGNFFSAEWDDWENIDTSNENNYKLRRVIPIQ
jgi:NAD(P)-dependent dehydrogenase (short-subunit alcohol dehydrogenase family)